ncbi:3-deoxy-7-phosphoheptulonate synthase [Acetohalobium arabaticum]|uniref:3-deoxy-D-arabinoheptulosonate-7-phosphate synthase n=1 Tax=Acetohalobium arabaticum (strain ATCC 49924 / DSM 5501 / Z-7288) TaxID=574087 RepID=D9QS83_ACEAZ|nr:3-deoxy-7-phosphoheptulonate synthase [Acetohalobium arabaticum]ADL13374.1 3-deoxy-D-arabinoheptulosonate-7-phosphate synthase [Acetohalobium arabaticum DSM 5501]
MSQPAKELYPLAGKSDKLEKSIIGIGDIGIGSGEPTVIADFCAIESREKFFTAAVSLKEAGAEVLRYELQLSPYSSQGLEDLSLEMLAEVKEETGLLIATEVMDIRQVESIAEYVDILQIGSQNMQNYPLLREVGNYNLPVILKRGMSATIREWLLAAEYILDAGNQDVILCEQGIKCFQQYTENLLDISAVPIIRQLSHLPVIIDPSQAAGRSDLIIPLAKAGLAAGVDGVMVEVHFETDETFCTRDQSLTLSQFEDLVEVIGANRNVLS